MGLSYRLHCQWWQIRGHFVQSADLSELLHFGVSLESGLLCCFCQAEYLRKKISLDIQKQWHSYAGHFQKMVCVCGKNGCFPMEAFHLWVFFLFAPFLGAYTLVSSFLSPPPLLLYKGVSALLLSVQYCTHLPPCSPPPPNQGLIPQILFKKENPSALRSSRTQIWCQKQWL